MRLSPHFSEAEYCASDTAARLGIDNSLPMIYMQNAHDACAALERIRAHLTVITGHTIPIIVSSGYRCLELNSAIGSNPSSDHTRALAADIKAPEFGTPLELAKALAPVMGVLQLGQVIYEFGSWVHISVRQPEKYDNRLLTITAKGTQFGIVET